MMKISFPKAFIFTILPVFINCSNVDSIENTNEWVRQANIPEEALRVSADIITYKNEAYLLPGKGGYRFSKKPEILKYSNDQWTEVTTYEGFANAGNSASIRNNDEIYILGGVNGSSAPTTEVRAYSISKNTFRDEHRFASAAIATYTETKAYFIDKESFSSFDFISEKLEELPKLPYNGSIDSTSLTTINNEVYVLFSSLEEHNFFKFDEASKKWIQLPNFPGKKRISMHVVSTKKAIYAGLGRKETNFFLDIWKYDTETNAWQFFAEYPGKHFLKGFAFELNGQLFFGGGFTDGDLISTKYLNEKVYSINAN